MKKEQKRQSSLFKYYSAIFHIITMSSDTVVSRKGIEANMHMNLGNRILTDILRQMVSDGHLVREKLKGMKRKGYAVNEEIIAGKFHESYVTTDNTNQMRPKYEKRTQRELNQDIKTEMRNYRKKIGNKKYKMNQPTPEALEIFFVYHTTWITLCLTWIARLTLSIDGGIFQDKENKIAYARKNIELLENFIQLLCFKVQERNPDNYDLFLTSMHNLFEWIDPFQDSKWARTKKPSSSTR